jgi:hypothetical protein
MKDIRQDLKERLADIEQERARLQARLAELTHIESGLKSLLEDEDKRWKPTPEMLPLFPRPQVDGNGKYTSPLSRSIVDSLKFGPRSLKELKETARLDGIDFGDKNAGRSIHFALVGMAQNNLVERLENGKWRLAHENEKGH